MAEEKLQNLQGAFQALNEAASLLPGRDDIKASLGELCVRALSSDPAHPKNFYDTAVRISNEFLARNPKSFPALRMKGNLALLDHRPGEAVEYWRRARLQRSNDPDVTIHLFESLVLSGNDIDAERTAMQHITLYKRDGAVYDALYQYYFAHNRLGDVERILKLKIANNPNEPNYVTQLSQFYWRSGRKEQAVEVISAMLAKPTRPTAARLAAGDFYASIGRIEEANHQFEEGLRSAPDQEISFEKRMLNLIEAQGNIERAAALADQILAQAPQDEQALAVRANHRAESGQPMALAGAVEDYRILLRTRPRDPKLHFAFARLLRLRGDLASAKAEVNEAIRLDPNHLDSQIALAEIVLLQHNWDEAIRLADGVLIREPRNTRARLLKAQALWGAGRDNESRSELERLVQIAPNEKSTYLQLGLLEIEQKNFQKAETAFEKLQDEPLADSPILDFQPQIENASAVLKKELDRAPNHALVHELLARVAVQIRQYDRAINEYRTLQLITPGASGTYLGIAEVFRLKGDWNNYVLSLEQARRLAPGDSALTIRLAAALEEAGRHADAVQQYRRALEFRPDDARILSGLASAIVEAGGNLDESLRLVKRALDKTPAAPNLLDTLGWIYVRKKMTSDAIQLFNGLVRKYPDDSLFRYHLGVALLQQGDAQGARSALQLALASKPSKENADRIRALLRPLIAPVELPNSPVSQ